MHAILEPLLSRPDLPQLVAMLNDQLQQERQRREIFIRDLAPDQKAEFIAGETVLHSPATAEHILVTGRLHVLLKMHVLKHGLGEVFVEKALVHLTRNDYEPDVLFFGPDKAAQVAPDQMLFPAPDFIAEVLSDSTEARDRGIKFDDYALHDVSEYWIIDASERTVEQYSLLNKQYKLKQKLAAGTISSLVVPGFEIPIAALFENEALQDAVSR